ncbi:MAG TPA: hypothetical protein VMM78_04495 [Thermomicrobiales bacterium]|nr:hypothetical protein [Thermomicrobiales bacterium]
MATLILVALAVTACAPAAVERPIGTPIPSASPTSAVDGVSSPSATTQAVNERPRVERVTLSTRIDGDGAPVDETTVVSEWPEMIYLCVLMSEIAEGTRLRAYWFAGSDIVGQSDMSPPPSNGRSTWVALRYRPVAKLNPAVEHAVELRLGDILIDRYFFRVGVGEPSDAIAELAFASGFDEHGEPTDVRARFMPHESPLRLLMRISNQVNPSGMDFASLWYRGDAQIAHIDGSELRATGAVDADPRRIEFVYAPPAQLTPGAYHVDVLLNGMAIRTVRFTISIEPPPPTRTPQPTATTEPSATPTAEPTSSPMPSPSPTPSPRPSPTPPPSPTPVALVPEIRDVTVATMIDESSRAPLDGPIFSVERPSGTLADLWVAIFVTDLSTHDLVEVAVQRDGVAYGRVALASTGRASGWIAVAVHLDVPSSGGAFVYTFEVVLNGQRALASSCQIRAA